MRHRTAVCIACLWNLAVSQGTIAAPAETPSRLSGYVTLTSDYRARGISQSRGEPSLQVGTDYQHRSGFFTGGRAASVEYRAPRPDAAAASHGEVSVYAGYGRRFGRWSLNGSIGRYAYPGSDYDWDYDSVGGSVGFRDRLFLTTAYSDDFFGTGAAATDHEIAIALPVAGGFEIGAGIGRFRASDLGVGYTHWNLGASRLFGRTGVDVRYYDNGYDGPRYEDYDHSARPPRALPGTPSAGEWVLTVSYGFSARR